MNTYISFVEYNDWEGETWKFYIPVDNNMDAITKIEYWIKLFGKSEEFHFMKGVLTEPEVDTLCKYGGEGYMPYHNKLNGILEIQNPPKNMVEFDELFYKGGIEKLMRRQD